MISEPKEASLSQIPTKAELRRIVLNRSAQIQPDTVTAASTHILHTLEQMPEFIAARTIALYWSLPGEVATHSFIEKWHGQKRILLPVMHGDGLWLCPFDGKERLTEKRFGVWEPSDTTTPVDPVKIDLIVVPAVGFDREGRRLGHGKGYYDRLLTGIETLKVGICFGFQLFDRIPAEAHDIAMDRVIAGSSEKSVLYICRENEKP